MSDRLIHVGALAAVVAVALLAQAPAAGQTERTPWGDPNLQGVYTFATPTPMERPLELADKESYTPAELAEAEAQFAAAEAIRWAREGALEGPPDDGYDRTVWFPGEEGKLTNRTSLVVDPPNGRIPPMTPHALALLGEQRAEAESRRVSRVGDDGEAVVDTVYNIWSDLSLGNRCQARTVPRTGGAYNHGVQIVQTPGFVVLRYESMHDARIIPLDRGPAPDASIRQWNGISRGHWEDETLVVHLTNFTDGTAFSGVPMGNMEFVERFTRVDEHTLAYEVTVNDPTMWTAPWTFMLPLRGDDEFYQFAEDLYEYACHEGNYRMMEEVLKGSRTLLELGQD